MIIGGTKRDERQQWADQLGGVLASAAPVAEFVAAWPWMAEEQAELLLDGLSQVADRMFDIGDELGPLDPDAIVARVRYDGERYAIAAAISAHRPAPKPEPELKLTTRGKVVGGIAIATALGLVAVALNILAGPARADASTYPNGETQCSISSSSTISGSVSPRSPKTRAAQRCGSSPVISPTSSQRTGSMPSTGSTKLPSRAPSRTAWLSAGASLATASSMRLSSNARASISSASNAAPTRTSRSTSPAPSRSTSTPRRSAAQWPRLATTTVSADCPLSPGVRATTGTSNPRVGQR